MNLDNTLDLGYNDSNDENVVVKMDEQRPIHDIECKHETLVPDPEDTLGEAVYHGCANNKCGIGFYILKHKNDT